MKIGRSGSKMIGGNRTNGAFRQKPVGWQGESYRHYLAAKYGFAGGRRRYAALHESDFVRQGGETFFRGADGMLVNIRDARDVRIPDEETMYAADVLESVGVTPWVVGDVVRAELASPAPYYAVKERFFVRRAPGVQDIVRKGKATFPIVADKLQPGRRYPLKPSVVKRVLQRMPEEDIRGIKEVRFVNPKGEQEGAWAQYVRGTRRILIFSQPYDPQEGLLDGQDPRWVQQYLREYVLPHEVGHHKALYRAQITDKDLRVAEARADANVVGMAPTDRDIKQLVR